ncbi:uncharacterized protein G2W53_039699 [Senna tora]|uniref:Uncharacterized protein n=1 Tax=Senna tora TaxID=362788 RepID=A0A834SQZ8_9FABA|nr:uncharacterized protein G2W53_039697 [Senna tora]KAF7807538.1 uncharacterized protein G2W53_039699 [Senna tora]
MALLGIEYGASDLHTQLLATSSSFQI